MGKIILKKYFLILFFISLNIAISSCGKYGGVVAKKEIGVDGGTIEVTDQNSRLYGTKITIPEGAIDHSITVVIKEAKNTPTLPAASLVGGASLEILPDGQQFNKAVQLEVPFDISPQVNSAIFAVWYNEESDRWEPILPYSIDENKKTISVLTSHFSLYQVVFSYFDLFETVKSNFSIATDALNFENVAYPPACSQYADGICTGVVEAAKIYRYIFESGLKSKFDTLTSQKIGCETKAYSDSLASLLNGFMDIPGFVFAHNEILYASLISILKIWKEPQLLSLWDINLLDWNCSPFKGAHAVLVTGWDAENSRFEIYDPNYNGDYRYILVNDNSLLNYKNGTRDCNNNELDFSFYYPYTSPPVDGVRNIINKYLPASTTTIPNPSTTTTVPSTTTSGPTTTTTVSSTTTSQPTTTTTVRGDLDTVQSIYDTLVSIPSGTFEMGCSTGDTSCYSQELPQHTVTISNGFKMSAYEITQGQWQAVMGSNPSYFTSCGSDCPVEQVSWNTIQTFITTLNSLTGRNYRLPTEAEWEYAARAGTITKFYCGNDETCLETIAWYASNAGSMTHPVGEKAPNNFGLYDMSGNVWEWVNDWYGSYSSGSVVDPQGPPTGSDRVRRGGAWSDSIYCRSSYRISGPYYSGNALGFRLCLP